MNLNEVFIEFAEFWNNISPIIVAHIVAYIAIRKIWGLDLNIVDRIRKLIKIEKYSRVKEVMQEFSLWTKLPFLLIIFFLIYFTILNSLINLQLKLYLAPMKISYTETGIWFAHSGILEESIETIAFYSPNTLSSIHEILDLKQKFLEKYKYYFPDQYDSRIEWIKRDTVKYHRYYHITYTFIAALFIFGIYRMIKHGYKKFPNKARYFLLIIILIFTLLPFRYAIENGIEQQIKAEVHFVATMLKMDEEITINKDDEEKEEINRIIEMGFSREIKEFVHDFWLLSVLREINTLREGQSTISNTDF